MKSGVRGLGAVRVGATKLVEWGCGIGGVEGGSNEVGGVWIGVVKIFYHAGNALAFLGNVENMLSQVMPRCYPCQMISMVV